MIRYYITDRNQIGGAEALLECAARRMAEGVDWIQVREKDLPDRELLSLARRILRLPNPRGTRVLVNSRADIAMAAGAHGVHLPSNSPPPSELRRIVPAGFPIGVSCHTTEELETAEDEGADFAVYGPVFAPRSKASPGEPLGLEALADACRRVRMPVLALGGVRERDIPALAAAGAAGYAAISLFQQR